MCLGHISFYAHSLSSGHQVRLLSLLVLPPPPHHPPASDPFPELLSGSLSKIQIGLRQPFVGNPSLAPQCLNLLSGHWHQLLLYLCIYGDHSGKPVFSLLLYQPFSSSPNSLRTSALHQGLSAHLSLMLSFVCPPPPCPPRLRQVIPSGRKPSQGLLQSTQPTLVRVENQE